MPKISVDMESKEGKLIAGILAVCKAEDKMAAGLDKVKQRGKQAAAGHKELERAAKRVYESTRTPQERYNARLQHLDQLLKRGKISTETYGRAARQAQSQLRGMGQAGTRAVGPQMLGHVKNLAGAFGMGVGLAGAIGVARKALNDLTSQREEVAAMVREIEKPIAKLTQLTPGQPKAHAELIATAERIYAKGGAESQAEALNLVFELQSGGQLKDADFFARMYGIEELAGMAGTTGKLRAAMGAEETGSAREIVSKAVAAATPATKVTPGAILEAAAEIAESAKKFEMSDEELIAAISVLSEKTSPATAGTRVDAMLTALAKAGFVEKYKGRPLSEMLDVVRQKKMSTPQLIEWFGRKEGERGFSGLDPEKYAKRLGEVQGAAPLDLAGQMIATAEKRPEVAAGRFRRQQKAQLELSRKVMGIARNVADAVVAREQREIEQSENRMLPGLTSWWHGWQTDMERWRLQATKEGGDVGFLKGRYVPEVLGHPALARQIYGMAEEPEKALPPPPPVTRSTPAHPPTPPQAAIGPAPIAPSVHNEIQANFAMGLVFDRLDAASGRLDHAAEAMENAAVDFTRPNGVLLGGPNQDR